MPDLDDHPITPGVRSDIQVRLSAIEAEHGVRVLYACESGSRGWGFASQGSDYDVRFIYVHPLPWYLRVSAQRDVIEVPISDELDINGWEDSDETPISGVRTCSKSWLDERKLGG